MQLDTLVLGRRQCRVVSGGTGPDLIYLHGFEHHPGDAPFLRALARNRRIIAPEQPGYGESTNPDGLRDPGDVVLALQELLGRLDVERADVIGHCLGGMFAAELAARCPRLVRRLILVGAYGLWLDDAPAPDPFFMTRAELARAKWYDSDVAPDPEPSILGPLPDDQVEAVVVRTQNLATATTFLSPLPDRGLARRLPCILAPTMVVHGDADALVPRRYAEEFVRLIPSAELVTIPRAGHLPMIEQVDAFVALVDQFLT